MVSMRARTLSGLSSFLVRSFGLSGSRYPSAHWPSPRGRRTGALERVLAGTAVAVMRASSCYWVGTRAPETARNAADVSVEENAGAVARPESECGRRQEAGHMALRTRP